MTNKTKKAFLSVLGVLAALLVWQAVSMTLKNGSALLASPIDVVKKLFSLLIDGNFRSYAAFSLFRIAAGFIIAFILGITLASVCGRFPAFGLFLRPYMLTVKSVPVASFIVLALIWLTSSSLSVFISFLMVLPVIYTNVLEGILKADKHLTETADVFGVRPFKRILYIYLPSVRPFLISACRVSLGLAWKAGIAAEVIGVADGSIGEKLYYAKVYLDSAELLAWTVIIVMLSLIFEKAFLALLNFAFDRLKRI